MSREYNIYFFGSINGGTSDIKPWYRPMIRRLEKFGTVLSADIFFKPEILEGTESDVWPDEIFERDIAFINRADVLVGDVTIPSTGVGYELGHARAKGKPILCLHRSTGHSLSAIIEGNSYIVVRYYKALPAAYGHITRFFKSLRTQS